MHLIELRGPSGDTGAHRFLHEHVFPATPMLQAPRSAGYWRGALRGTQLDSCLSSLVRSGTAIHGPLVSRKAKDILATLRDLGVTIHDTQLGAKMDCGVVPLMDLVGTDKQGCLVVVEVKTGATAGSAAIVTPGCKFRPPFDTMRDTWRCRQLAQLAMQMQACMEHRARNGVPCEVRGMLVCVQPSGAVRVIKQAPTFWSKWQASWQKWAAFQAVNDTPPAACTM